jgi:excisionase family DNA binding protein
MTNAPTKPTLLTKSEAARELRVCVRTIENFMQQRRLSHIRLGRAVRIERYELERLKSSLTVRATAD